MLDADLQVVPAADSFLRQVRFGRDGAESTTRSYAYSIALFLRWCARSGRTWQSGVEQVGLFMTWLAHALPAAPGDAGGVVLRGPGAGPARGARRVNAVLAAVRGMTVHAVAEGTAGGASGPAAGTAASPERPPARQGFPAAPGVRWGTCALVWD